MKKITVIALVTVLFAITGCGSPRQPTLDLYAGISEIELIRELGTPHRHYTAGDSRFLTYEFQERKVLKGVHPTSMMGLPPLMTGAPSRIIHRYCTTTFEVIDGKVVDWRADGNACPFS